MGCMTRRGMLKGLGGAFAASALAGCAGAPFAIGHGAFRGDRLKFGVIGAGGKGFTDWTKFLANGEIPAAICDVDRVKIDEALAHLAKSGVDVSSIATYTDYRRMFDDQSKLGLDVVNISTPDHMHAAQAVRAMREGVHCYIQKPLARTLWETEYVGRVAHETGRVVQMGNQGSAAHGHRRHVELLQKGVIGDVTEVYVWTDRPIWFQGESAKRFAAGRMIPAPANLDWDCWLGIASNRPYIQDRPADTPWPFRSQYARSKLGVYHDFNWRAYYDFGTGAFGDMACHTMNLPFRGAELASVKSAEADMVCEWTDVAYPAKSRVKLLYAARPSNARPGVTLPETTVYWYDGGIRPAEPKLKPMIDALAKIKEPRGGCIICGTKGMLASLDAYGIDCIVMMNGEAAPTNTKEHEACRESVVAPYLPRVKATTTDLYGDTDKAHIGELCLAIRGEGEKFPDGGRCFSGIDYATSILEGMLVGCLSQQLNRRLEWDAAKRTFDDADANALIRPYVRKGWEF